MIVTISQLELVKSHWSSVHKPEQQSYMNNTIDNQYNLETTGN